MTNLPGYVKAARGFLVGRHMREETLWMIKLLVSGLILAILATIAIVALEHHQHQYLSEIIRGALRGFFNWVDTWR